MAPCTQLVRGPALSTTKNIKSMTIKQNQYMSGNHKQYDLCVLFCQDTH